MEMLKSLPNDVIVEILSWVPVNSLMRFRWACKSLFDLITRNPTFVKMHLLHSTSDHEITNKTFGLMSDGKVLYSSKYKDLFHSSSSSPLKPAFMVCMNHPFGRYFEILGSCNGLIYLGTESHHYFLWNPSTTEFKKLPRYRKPYREYKKCSTICGFGYDQTMDDYKVIEIEHLDLDGFITSRISIYTLGSNSWSTKIGIYPIVLDTDMHMLEKTEFQNLGSKSGLLVSGAIHWMIMSPLGLVAILCFDVVKEEHREIQLPTINPAIWEISRLVVLNGCLCIFLVGTSYQNAGLWMMKDYGTGNESWNKVFTINVESLVKEISQGNRRYFSDLELLKYSCEDVGILIVSDLNYLITYDPKSNDITIEKTCTKVGFAESSYIESLVSVKSSMYLSSAAAGLQNEVESTFSEWNVSLDVLSRIRQRGVNMRSSFKFHGDNLFKLKS